MCFLIYFKKDNIIMIFVDFYYNWNNYNYSRLKNGFLVCPKGTETGQTIFFIYYIFLKKKSIFFPKFVTTSQKNFFNYYRE